MTDEVFQALARQLRQMPMSPFRGFARRDTGNGVKAKLENGSWIKGEVEETISSFTINFEDGSELVIPKTYIRPS